MQKAQMIIERQKKIVHNVAQEEKRRYFLKGGVWLFMKQRQQKAVPTMVKQYTSPTGRHTVKRAVRMYKWLYIIMLPGLVYYIIFKFLPMWGVLISLQDFNPYTGFFDSPWVGLKHFKQFFTGPKFVPIFLNTLGISVLNITLSFPAPIILSLLINELRKDKLKRAVQTCVYIPHFLSWVIVASLTYTIFSGTGVINRFVEIMGGESIDFLTSTTLFRPMIVGQTIWKETGWGTIVFLAAMASVDVQLYEAAIVDGAGRFRQMWHVTLPCIRSTVVIMLILKLGSVLDTGFDQIFLTSNALNRSVSDVFDTYVYTVGITQGSFSFATAVGLFKSVVGIILIFGSNAIAKRMGESGIF